MCTQKTHGANKITSLHRLRSQSRFPPRICRCGPFCAYDGGSTRGPQRRRAARRRRGETRGHPCLLLPCLDLPLRRGCISIYIHPPASVFKKHAIVASSYGHAPPLPFPLHALGFVLPAPKGSGAGFCSVGEFFGSKDETGLPRLRGRGVASRRQPAALLECVQV